MKDRYFIPLMAAIIIGSVLLASWILVMYDGYVNEYWRDGAPNGVYQQREWGFIDKDAKTWFFAVCDHSYLGPLHGTFTVSDNVIDGLNLKEYVEGAGSWSPDYAGDPKLYLRIEDNTIVATIKRIRRKFKEIDPNFDCIKTENGMGYRWVK